MRLGVVATAFLLVFLGELPDKTMFASLVLAAKGRPLAIWGGAAAAFAVHVGIAISVGVALFELLPHRAVHGLVAAMFLAAAVLSFATRNSPVEELAPPRPASGVRTATTAAVVIFVAEWGDLTQLIVANLAARSGAPLSVAIGSIAALWCAAALAVVAGNGILGRLRVRALRITMAVVLACLGLYTLAGAW